MLRSTESDRIDALELENHRLKRAVEELSLLNDLSREIGASLESQKVMARIVRRALQAVKAEQGVIALLQESDSTSGRTFVRVNSSTSDHPAYRLHDQLLGWMYLHRVPLLIEDPPSDERFKGFRWNDEIRSLLCVPLLVRSRLTGVLAVFNKKSGGGFVEEDKRLLSIIASQSAQIIENARLYEEERALVGMREELRLAERIQAGLLPAAPPLLPGYELAGQSIPAQTVGGDYFDYFAVDEHRMAICVADVSGKGLSASLLMSNVQAALRSRASSKEAPNDTLRAINNLLRRSMRRGTFVTMIYGILDARTNKFSYANAGHNRPLLRRNDGMVQRLEAAGLALGLAPDAVCPAALVELHSGDELLLYSDGITESMNKEGDEWGEARLGSLLTNTKTDSAARLLEVISQAVRAHTGSAPQHDDMTIVLVRRL